MTFHSPFACHSHRFRLGARPFDRAAARIESARSKARLARFGRFLRPMQPFPLSIRPRFERMPAPAFGLAGGSATKTGGYNRLAGKT